MSEGDYTNAHRAFLQACARYSVLPIKQAQVILESVLNKCEYYVFCFD